ncbi:uncharacterized protein EDB93DRAFT_1110036 [Suillus bovinus]|uniref:uncharacterized protein n=1 Tax=Suillus bovinus TaxID=48563 RepID=UPI001B8689D6|nr:uncharacterized protein EDB93DRAFT_1110036 [Suillus bovinus]KAG2125710.1 hypothetical protein EDB93DRAFT_1110036 [Suillus bovinus]
MSNLYCCVCRRHGGRHVQIRRTTYYDHLREAETDEEREQIINAQDDPEAIQLIRKYLSKRCASATHAPPGKRTCTASPHHQNDEPHQPQNDEPLQPQNDEPPHPTNDEPHQPQNDKPPYSPDDENLQPRDNEPPHPPNDEPHQPQNDEPPHPPDDENLQP